MRDLHSTLPLSEEQFNAMKLVLTVKAPYANTSYFNTMTYDHYLGVRKELVRRQPIANAATCCMVNPLHEVTIRWYGSDVSITEDAATGEIIRTDSSGDCDVNCVHECAVDFACNWEEYESLVP